MSLEEIRQHFSEYLVGRKIVQVDAEENHCRLWLESPEGEWEDWVEFVLHYPEGQPNADWPQTVLGAYYGNSAPGIREGNPE